MDRHETRLAGVKKALKQLDVQALLVSNYTNVTYLTGFTGDSSYLLVTRDEPLIVSDTRYTEQLDGECPGLRQHIRSAAEHMHEAVGKVLESTKLSRVAIEADSMTVSTFDKIKDKAPQVAFKSSGGVVEALREIKDKHEIDELKRAVKYAERGFQILRATLRPERTEKEVADDLENQLRLLGASGASFEPIVAVGPRAALPHARANGSKIGDDDFVLVDWGAASNGYRSDLTRVLVTGKIPPKLERVYRVVLSAQEQAIAAIRPGVTGKDVDTIAREVIAKAGYSRHFGHGLGHGIGLNIHEGPRLSPTNEKPLKAGMVVTVEPGIYLTGWGGVRIEDDVLVTKTGHEVLTSVPKQFEQAIVS